MEATNYTITSITETTAQDAQLRVVRAKLVKYMVGTDGPFTLVAAPGNDDPAQIRAALQNAANAIAQLRTGG